MPEPQTTPPEGEAPEGVPPGRRPPVDVHVTPEELRAALTGDVRAGLTRVPKELPPKYFYDARGSELFEDITRLPEYYPTRTERAILVGAADDIVGAVAADTLVELGSGSSEKTRLLLDALDRAGRLRRYVPVDVSPAALSGALEALGRDYPRLELHGVVADFEAHLGHLPDEGVRLVAFLGSTIGNFGPQARHSFLSELRAELREGDALLLGTDLVKDPRRLVAAYDDAAGVTAEFNRNVLLVLNRELGAGFRVEDFEHVARWNAEEEQVQMWLRARRAHTVRIADLALDVPFAEGEEVRTEISAKFRRAGLEDELARAGFALRGWWTDPAVDFALSLSTPTP